MPPATRTAPPSRPVPPARDAQLERANTLVHDAWRVTAGVLVDPASATRAGLLAGVRAAREGSALLRTITPLHPEAQWLERAAKLVEQGATRLQQCADLCAKSGSGQIDFDALMRHCEEAEGDFDLAWEFIARDR